MRESRHRLYRTATLLAIVVCSACLWTRADAEPPDPAEKHWAFTAPIRPALPEVTNKSWSRSAIDRFVLAKLEAARLTPQDEADRYTLIRRVSLDLTGLPPTPEQADAFVADTGSDAYEKVVDRLLASEAYGEHWAGRWLDLARYADTQGYEKDNHRDIWRYRDWVIAAFNADMPYDQFTIEQIAGDLLPGATTEQKLATAFHRNTMTNTEGGTSDEEYRVAAVKDRVDTTMQVWMGVTMVCAKCHTHKYDPVSIAEYYRFYAYFNQTEDRDLGNDAPRIPTPTMQSQAEATRLAATLTEQQQALDRALVKHSEARTKWEADLAGQTQWITLKPSTAKATHGTTLKAQPDNSVLASGKSPDREVYTITADAPKGRVTAIRLEAMTDPSLGRNGPGRNGRDPNFVVNEFVFDVIAPGDKAQPQRIKLTDARAAYSQKDWPVANSIDGNPKTGWAVSPKFGQPHAAIYALAKPLDVADGTRLRFTMHQLYGNKLVLGRVRLSVSSSDPKALSPTVGSLPELVRIPRDKRTAVQSHQLDLAFAASQPELAKLNSVLAKTRAAIAAKKKSGPTTPVMVELPVNKRRVTKVHNRGNWLDQGDVVKPAVPIAFGALPSGAPANRLGVAQWLVRRDNPLTARTHVNRIWAQLFGVGIVETEGDLGTQGTPPSHRELLDWLAVEFMDTHKWSQKKLLKAIVTSAAYRQSARVDAKRLEADGRNRLISRGPRFRLSAEMVRDQSLATSGLLTHKLYGPSVMPPQPDGIWSTIYNKTSWKNATNEDRFRRGLYTYWRRTSPYPSMLNFDAGSREVCQIRRIRTNTPLQALVLMNDPVYVEAAGALALRAISDAKVNNARAARMFRLALVRPPADREVDRLVAMQKTAHARFANDAEAAKSVIAAARITVPDGADPVDVAAWVVVANVVLNLDETVTKP